MYNEPHLRFSLLFNGHALPVSPTVGGTLKLTREAMDDAFYLRDKLSGPLLLGGADDPEAWRILYALDNSRDRCLPLYLILETRVPDGEWQQEWRGTFTCSECKFNLYLCQVEVSPVTDDGYREVLENWEKEFNVLAYSNDRNRRTVTAQLATLNTGTRIEFLRIDSKQEADYVGDEGWAVFLRNKSWISSSVGRSRDVILFRYRQDNVQMVPIVGSTEFSVVDKSAGGWEPLFQTMNLAAIPVPTISYVKTPDISGFPRGGYTIGTYRDWFGQVYGDQLVLRPCNSPNPDRDQYIEVTGTGGANNDRECGGCLNLRRSKNDKNCQALFWKFGEFRFTRGFPVLDAIYGLLQATVAGTTAAGIVPPSAADLSDFFTNPINPATGAQGYSNEIPGLLLSAASDVKRYGASEPATKVMISLKTLLDDLATLYDVGWFIDPDTGWFRVEHRSYREISMAASALDLTKDASAILPAVYSYQNEKLPRTEELTVSNALTENPQTGMNWAKGDIAYTGACVNTREGQNKTTKSASRLTGDVAGMVLSGESLPDSALVLLAAAPDGTLEDGNRKVSVTELLKRYHRYGRVRTEGTIAGQPVQFQSVKPGKLQEGISLQLCTLALFTPGLRLTTNLGSDARAQKVELDLLSGVVSLSVALPAPDTDEPGPLPARRAFNDSFSESFA